MVIYNINTNRKMTGKMAVKEEKSSKYIEYNGTAVLEGEDAERFLEYDSTDLTEEEELSLIKSDEIYNKYCKS